MEKKRSVGVTAVGIMVLMLGILIISYAQLMLVAPFKQLSSIAQYPLFLREAFTVIVFPIVFLSLNTYRCLSVISNIVGLIYLISGFNILKLKNWSRVLAVCCSSFIVISLEIIAYLIIPYMQIPPAKTLFINKFILPILVPNVLFSLVFIYYLTRPKVKEQFREGWNIKKD